MCKLSVSPKVPLWCTVIALLCLEPGCKARDAAPAANAPPTVPVAVVQRGSIAHTLSLAGQFEPYQVVEVHAKVAGYLRHIYVDIGDKVREGQVLATLEVPELAAQYSGTQAEALRSVDAITTAEGEVNHARSLHAALEANFERLRKASEEQPGVIAAQELDNARSQAEASQAQIDAALSALSGAKQGAAAASADQQRVGALRGYTTVTAPLQGVITWRYADTGALIQTGTNSETQSLPIVKLSQSDVLRLRVPVPEDAIRYIHKGDPMQIHVAAMDQDFSGRVVRFARNLDLSTRTMQTEVDVPNADLRITPGMYANTYLTLAHRESVLTVPIAAIQGTASSPMVLVVNGSNQVERRPVQVGLRGSLLVEVTQGLKAGDRVLLGGGQALKENDRVTAQLQEEPTNDTMREEGGMTDPFTDAGESTKESE